MADHPSDCPQYCCSDFANFLNDLLAEHPKPDLKNDIHPLLTYDKFPMISEEGYRMLELTLRLATKMLEDDRTVEYVVTTVDGSLHLDHDVASKPGREVTYAEIDAQPNAKDAAGISTTRLLRYPRARLVANDQLTAPVWVTDDMRQRARDILRTLAEVLERIDVVDMFGEGRTNTTNGILSPAAQKMFPRGQMAKITFSQTTIGAFLQYKDPHCPQALAEQYILARSFVHELAHVLSQAVNGARQEEVYYKDCVLAEAGFDLENALFGGIASMHQMGEYTEHPKDLTGQAVIQELYPTGRLSKQYAGNGASVGQRAELDEFCTVQRIPWLFMTTMFTEKFWREDVPNMGSGPIQPKKKVRWVIKLVLPGEEVLLQDGNQMMADAPMIITCSPTDRSLPIRVQEVLKGIKRTQRRVQAQV
ncbi:uncharacterized protein RCC_02537 [Ramularia collo-cygni]|uniref:Uncharacterized protein n=1 Tax=Ramularia collo-cygni TaxID=112498 RepID=A0A2D3UMM8_9PEZI|nr:uncharacterized protein RCC_02537 [Ramularia collo-cygni]CZT16702.1 uncharacterized protein RCC_02537 [Ramularia collo-cygni]